MMTHNRNHTQIIQTNIHTYMNMMNTYETTHTQIIFKSCNILEFRKQCEKHQSFKNHIHIYGDAEHICQIIHKSYTNHTQIHATYEHI